MKRRLPRRQGVVYGPLARQDRTESGGITGRLIGGAVVVAALAVLAVAGMNFLGGDPRPGGGASPSPTAGSLASPTRSPSPTTRPTASPTPTAVAPTASPSPSPSPTPVAIVVRTGPGFVTLGANYRTDPARIIDASATFNVGDRIAWLADLGGSAGSTNVTIVVARVGTDGSETTTFEEPYEPNSANSSIFLRRFRNVGQLIDGPGVYVVRYLVDGQVRSEGFFRVEP